jgi:hypothetical protein
MMLILVVPGSADHYENFQDYSADEWAFSCAFPGWCITDVYSYLSPEVVSLWLYARYTDTGLAYWDVPYASNYYAWTEPYISICAARPGHGCRAYRQVWLLDSSKAVLTSFDLRDIYYTGEYEIIRDPTDGSTGIWINGISGVSLGIPKRDVAIAPSYLAFYFGGGGESDEDYRIIYIDNFHAGSDDPRYWASTIPPNWTVVRDMTNSALSGLYAVNPNNGELTPIRTTYMESYWSRATGTTENRSVQLIHDGTSTVYESLGTTGFSGFVRNNLSVLINPNSTAQYGQYEITYHNSVYGGYGINNHAYFYLIGGGATIVWDKYTYQQGDTATITYDITSSYWDTGTYNYYIKIRDIYGNTLLNDAIISPSGNKVVPLTYGTYLDNRIYYALLTAIRKSDGEEITMCFNVMEMQYIITYTGYITNALNGTPIVGANITVNQSSTYYYGTSITSGFYSLTGMITNFETITSITATGYNPSYTNFTPLMQQVYTINVSMIPTGTTFRSPSIGGIIKDSAYKRPISGATVFIVNGTYSNTTPTNTWGWYYFDNLLANSTYYVHAEKYGYSVSTNTSVNATVR